MTVALWVVSVVLLALGTLVIVGTWAAVIGTYWTKKSTSLIPFVGGVFGLLGCLACPDERVSRLWWLPLVLDFTVWLLPLGFIVMFVKSRDTKPRSGSGRTKPDEPEA